MYQLWFCLTSYKNKIKHFYFFKGEKVLKIKYNTVRESACVCVHVLDEEGSWVFASTALEVATSMDGMHQTPSTGLQHPSFNHCRI